MAFVITFASLVLVCLCGFSVVSASWWDSDHDWDRSPPANCPHVNNHTHVCSTLTSTAGICGLIDCCSNFEDDDSANAYDEDMDGDTDNMYYLSGIGDNCPVCVAFRNCTLYNCEEKCCDGYQLVYGICQETTTEEMWCDHGMLYGDFCMCKEGFTGYNCEIPQCNCFNGGDCEVVYGRPTCICPDGYTGTQCEHVPCSLQCENGGTCTKQYNGYGGYGEYCRCPEHYIGTICSIRHTNSPNCPRISSNSTRDCFFNCGVDNNCKEEEFCCKEGCSTICRQRNPGTCYHNGQWYQEGEHFMIECNNCVCMSSGHAACTKMECPPSSSRFSNCPRSVTINVTANGEILPLTEQSTNTTAYHRDGKRAKVTFKHETFRYCRCVKPSEHPIRVIAYAEGTTDTCHFNVIVSDNMAPEITSCPEDVYVFENERVHLPKPTFRDNVGIYKENKNDIYGKEYFEKGLYFAVYCIKDYEGNTATCKVKVTVSDSDEDFDSLPLGHRRRSTGTKPSAAMIGGIGASAFIAIIVGVVFAFLCCRWRSRKAESANTRASRSPRSVRSSPESIYAVPSDVAKLPPLPPYTPKAVASAPPPYSSKSDMKDSVYMSLAPPSYQETANVTESYVNPAYETLRVHTGQNK